MDIGETLYVTNRDDWRSWLNKNHTSAKEIWLIYYKKASEKPRIPYDDAVEEALCFGWIDSTVKKFNEEATVQRFTPRRKNSFLSELNKERVKKMIAANKMTSAGMDSIKHYLDEQGRLIEYVLPDDILNELKTDSLVWKNFEKFPESYKRIRIAFIDGARNRPEEFQKRLNHFKKMTAKNKLYGTIPINAG